ncbi:hypothetical protein [Dyadobacter fermentans]|uniref:Uncharacterized protein n=1 Tax=Dyadobacter fermentans (strain ATCC 700827 / DSM 18053 / CIP 107007 / KCTC 52180 / NS114) TaxID=471854 RepID=C6VVL9_DYAFD|nr:hypothetical protein [Dyadobacter fermentans]ACT96749.1 hypothetical protein Dfer_5559 [Dyadobacter fermentans DSM 18053]
MVDFLNSIIRDVLAPRIIFVLAGLGSVTYLFTFWFQNRFVQTNLPDLISTGFQIVSITSGCRLVLHVFKELCKPDAVMEMDKFYTGYGGAAVLWISITTLKKRFSKPS